MSDSAPPLTRVDRAVDWLVGANPAGAIYGTLTIAVLLAAESGLHDTYLESAGSAALALALYWLAHAYAELLGHRLAERERLALGGLGRALRESAAIVRGACAPLLALLICWLVGAPRETAVGAALWTAIASLLVLELLAGVRVRARTGELLLEAGVGAAMGIGVLILRVILH